jgi:predicted ATPase/DNA-binding CsgD family transcriptional regulator
MVATLLPIIGREREINALLHMLRQPDCRLITLVGAGGIGKTRLAQEIALRLAAESGEETIVVGLQGAADAQQLPYVLANALGIVLTADEEHTARITRALQSVPVLILDNYDHLLPDVELIVGLRSLAPDLRLVVTSRETLKLRDEWVYPLDGLAVPPDESIVMAGQQYSAVELFLRFMQPLQRDAISDADLRVIARICRTVEGMPLALELASSWTRTLTPEMIAQEIERSLDFLASPLRDFPERHHSLRAVFDQSWRYLSDQERLIFARLSVLEGAFDRRAAEDVAGASLHVLGSLVEKSLLRLNADYRYGFHPLLRQYAAEKLAADYDAEAVRAAHARHFAGVLAHFETILFTSHHRDASLFMERNFNNIKIAWNWAIEHADTPLVRMATSALERFCDTTGRYIEWHHMLAAACDRLTAASLPNDGLSVLALVNSLVGWNNIRLGRYTESHAAFAHAQKLFVSLGMTPQSVSGSDPVCGLAMLAVLDSRYEEALRLANEAVKGATERQDWLNLQLSHYVASSAAYGLGDYKAAQTHGEQTRMVAEMIDDPWMVASAFMELGHIARIHGDFAQARRYYGMGYDIRRGFDDPEGMASFLCQWGRVDLLDGDPMTAEQRFRDSLALYKDLGDQGGLALAYGGLGDALLAQGEAVTARDALVRALEILIETLWTQTLLSTLVSAAEWLLRISDAGSARRILDYLLAQTALDPLTRRRVEALHASISPSPSIDMSADEVPGDLLAFARAVARIMKEIPVQQNDATRPQTRSLDALSERELEILRLLGVGMSNAEIAEKLVLAVGTVKAHNHNIFSKLGVDNRVRALARAREQRLL